MPNTGNRNLMMRVAAQLAVGLTFFVIMLFVPAGSLEFGNAWVFLILVFGGSLAITFYLYRHDPQLLERRLQRKERLDNQKFFRKFSVPLWICGLSLAGLDYRLGWSRRFLGSVPLWLCVLSQVLLCYSLFLLFQVLKINSFASSIVEVQESQKVISSGPYGIVRHPMYSALLLLILFTPFALGSYFALPAFALLVPVVIFRLMNEEKVLRQKLHGYEEYCRRTRFRLVPLLF